MHRESRESRVEDGSGLERTIVLQLLREDRAPRWSRAELGGALEADGSMVEMALDRLSEHGVLCVAEGAVWASRAARKLDRLGLICV